MLHSAGTAHAPPSGWRRRALGLVLAAAILFWGSGLELFLLYLCEIDDTSNPHSCPYSITALVVLAVATVATAGLCARVALRATPTRVVTGFVVGAATLVALMLVLAQATG